MNLRELRGEEAKKAMFDLSDIKTATEKAYATLSDYTYNHLQWEIHSEKDVEMMKATLNRMKININGYLMDLKLIREQQSEEEIREWAREYRELKKLKANRGVS